MRVVALAAWCVLFCFGCGDDTEQATQGSTGTATSTSAQGTGGGGAAGGAGGAAGSGGGAAGSGGAGATGGVGTGGASSIPDPGGAMAGCFWNGNGMHGSPDKALPVGIETCPQPYVGDLLDPQTGNSFFVFEAGPGLMSITFDINGNPPPDFVHLHDGTGLMFGPEIPPTTPNPPNGGTWTVVPGGIYVLEVHVPGGAFF